MTEGEWLHGMSVFQMCKSLNGLSGPRKPRLFACACCWRIVRLLSEPWRHLLELAEQHAQGEIEYDRLFEKWQAITQPHHDETLAVEGAMMPDEHIVSHIPLVAHNADSAVARERVPGYPPSNEKAFRAARGLEEFPQRHLLHDIFGNPFRPVAFDPNWRTSDAVSIARTIYESRDFSPMPILADALQDAGCEHEDILDHCRGAGPHVRGCWVVDLVLGKA